MADDDVLQAKLLSFICGNGGFVDLTVLLKSSSPLGSRKSEESAKKWLESRQGPRAGFACVKDKNCEIVGVRVDLGKKICHRYATKGVCHLRRCRQGTCKNWHICKTFVEGRCNEFCELSHDFYSDDNWEIVEALDLPFYINSNESMKKIVSWNLPQVCALYQRNECTWSECPYIHVCTQFIKASSHSNCFLPHDFEDSHNFAILEKYDLIPSSQVVNIDCIRSNVLIVEEQKRINTAVASSDPASEQNQSSSLFPARIREEINQVNNAQLSQILVCKEQQVDELLNCKMPRAASTNHLPTENALETTRLKSNASTTSTAVDSQTSLSSSQRINTAVVGSDPVSEQNQPSSLFTAGVQEEIDQVNTAQVAQILVCEEQQVDELLNCKMPRPASTNNLPGESASGTTLLKSNMLTTSTVVDSQTSLPSSQRINTAVFGSDPVSEQKQPSSLFTAGVQEEIDQVNTSQVAQILVCEEQQVDELMNFKMPRAASSNDLPGESASGTALLKSNMLTTSTVVDSQTSLPSSQRINTAVVGSDPVSEQNQPSSLFTAGVQEEIDQVNTAQVAQILVCEEQQVDELLNRKMPRAASSNDLLGESASGTALLKSNMLTTSTVVDSQTSLPSSQRINTAVVGSDPVSEKNQPSSLFTAGVQEEIDQVNTAQVAQILVCEEQQVDELLNCKMLRAASTNDLPGESASGTTLLKSNMLTTSTVVDSQTSLPSSQRINTAVVGSDPVSEKNQPSSLFTAGVQEEIDQVNTAQVAQILVCEEQQVDELLNRKMPRAASTNNLPGESASATTHLKSNMLTTVDSQTLLPSSQTQEVSEFKSSVPSTHCFLTEWRVFECLCKEYGSSASIQDIAGRKDLFPNGVESAEGWFREMTEGSFLITRGSQGTIAEVSAFSARARICVSYNENGRCHRPDCSFLHICRDFVTDSCSNGVTCPQRHYFHNSRDKAFLSRIKLDQFNDQQLRQLVLSSTPRICVEYNNGICDRGDDCNRIHMCCGHIRKCCSAKSECGLDHEEAMDTKHTQAVLRRYLLHNVEKREAIAMILDDKLCLSGKEKAKGQYLFVLFLFTY